MSRAALRTMLAAASMLTAPGLAMPADAVQIDTITTGQELVEAMHARYAGRWYRTLTFRQENTETRPDGSVHHSTWMEAMSNPGRLRIDFVPAAEGKGLLFVRDSQFVMDADTVARAVPAVHPLMVLGFDVYADAPARTVSRLEKLGFDLSTVRSDAWEGRPVWVVGSAAADTATRKQFWIDKERLVFVRMLQPLRDGGVSETRFSKYYQVAGGGWVAPEVEFLRNGKQNFLEIYQDVAVNVPLDERLFDPAQWGSAKGWFATGK